MTNMHDCGITIKKGNNRSESMISHGNTVRVHIDPSIGGRWSLWQHRETRFKLKKEQKIGTVN